ncbi:MAG: universal stress protein [Tropicimonas sp.]|uniref:universal stress protein n=1 Tax=Tropicimonas sp. TaxID=2067044 RepID=UPI003A8492FE
MTLRNILVAFNGSDSSAGALRYAASLAGAEGHVTALLAHSRHETVDSHGTWVPARAREIIAEANAEIIRDIEARFASLKDGTGLGDRLHFQRVAGRVDAVLSECARGYDLLVIGQARDEQTDEHVVIHPDRIALVSGRPVLIVPPGFDRDVRHSHAVVAWDGGRAAARALSDGLRLLEDGGRVSVLTVGEVSMPRPLSELMEHLKRHRIDAVHENISAEPGIARALLAYCDAHDPCLLVMGAYEHSKFREDFMGGVTARVLKQAPIPLLLSH